MSGPSCNPIRGQNSGHVTPLDQSEASIMSRDSNQPMRGQNSGHLTPLDQSEASISSSRRGTLAKLASIDEILEYEQEMAIMEKLNLNPFDK